jgi:hypothetical protein
MTSTTDIILDALNRAATARGIHEEQDLGGVYDQQWPEWYAKHMTQTLADAGYAIVRTGEGGAAD